MWNVESKITETLILNIKKRKRRKKIENKYSFSAVVVVRFVDVEIKLFYFHLIRENFYKSNGHVKGFIRATRRKIVNKLMIKLVPYK